MIIIPLMIQKAGVYSTDEDLGPKLELDLETILRFPPSHAHFHTLVDTFSL